MKTKLEAAQNIVDQLIKSSGALYDKPLIHQSSDDVSIHWDGPSNWATNDTYWQFEELASEFPMGKFKPGVYWIDPKGFHCEAIDYYSIEIYTD